MNLDETYRAWKERPTPLNVPPDFAGEVMRRVHREAAQRQAQRNWPGVLNSSSETLPFNMPPLPLRPLPV